jgi:hypothetical protein
MLKLIEKHRVGSNARMKYDMASPSYQHILESPDVSQVNSV